MKFKTDNNDAATNGKIKKRRVIYETVKTVVICLLCISTVYLSLKTLNLQNSANPLWHSGNEPTTGISSELTTENIMEAFLDFSEPELVIINKGEKRGELKPDNSGYEKIMDFADKVMESIHLAGVEYSRVSSDAVRKNLMLANSVYIKYPYLRLAEMDAQFFQVKDSAFAKNVTYYSQVFLLPDTTSGKVMVYVISEENPNEMIRIQTENFAATLAELINNLEHINKKEYAYASELNLDKAKSQSDNENILVFDSMVAIPLEKKVTDSILTELPWEYTNTLNFTQATDYSTGLMEIFSYNPNTIRQYVDKDGTLTFVSEKGTMSMDRNGIIKYKALDQSEGVVFSSSDSNRLYTSTAGVIKTVKKIMSLCYSSTSDENTDIRFTEMKKDSENIVSFKLDYFINGCKVKMKNGSAIEVKVHNGIMTELKMQIVSFKIPGKTFENISLINAIDEAYATGGLSRHIESAGLIYEFAGIGNEMNTKWELNAG